METLYHVGLIVGGGWMAIYAAILAWVAIREWRLERRYKKWVAKCKAKYGVQWQPWMGEDGDWLDQQLDADQRRRKYEGLPYLYDPDQI